MATLQKANTELKVPCRAVVGRSTLADIRLTSRRASTEHAWLGWAGGRWTLRDLGSSNGTTVNGRPLLTRDRAALSAGAKLCFGGDEESWLLIDASPPEPAGVLLGPQTYVWGQQSLLLLGPQADENDQPEASVFLDGDGWRVDSDEGLQSPDCGDIVRLDSGYWRLLLPEIGGASTSLTAGCELDVAQIELSFRVSANQVQALVLSQGPNQVQLPPRAYLNTLWELAKLRVEAGGASQDGGWVSAFDLSSRLKCSPEKVNVDIHRLRKLFQESGVHQAAQIIERDDNKRIRIGTTQITAQTQ